jgi:5-oxoprolinase (ATP-hydrolysing) subunit C
VIEIVSVAGLATVQDEGRAGHMHEGVPPGGPLCNELFSRANSAARNQPGEAAIEALGAIAIVAHGEVLVATDEGDVHRLREGEAHTLASHATCVRYLAVRGGIDVPCVLGGRGTLVVARLGGHEGRPLRRGDVLRVGAAPTRDTPSPPHRAIEMGAPVRVVLGPDLDRFDERTIAAFLASTFSVDARSDRVGTRLGGPRLMMDDAHGAAAVSAPMVRGAIQVPPSGEPIVLGPDHPTTGGYPVIATVATTHLDSLSARRIGAPVTFVI